MEERWNDLICVDQSIWKQNGMDAMLSFPLGETRFQPLPTSPADYTIVWILLSSLNQKKGF
jgi:hypothetical protein